MSNTDDPTLTLLEERFFDSDYRKSLLDHRLHLISPNSRLRVDDIRETIIQREWIGPDMFAVLRVVFNVANQLVCKEHRTTYLRAFYKEVECATGAKDSSRDVYIVKVSPHDVAWLQVVSARMKNANTARKE